MTFTRDNIVGVEFTVKGEAEQTYNVVGFNIDGNPIIEWDTNGNKGTAYYPAGHVLYLLNNGTCIVKNSKCMTKVKPFDRSKFARDLRFKHKKLGYSQNETSEIIGISKATYSRIMNEQFLPDIETFAKCCRWLGNKMEDYF